MKAKKVERKIRKKIWLCVFCKKLFDTGFSQISGHILSHIKEKPCFCKICGSSFSLNQNLRVHLNTVHSNLNSVKKKHETIVTCDLCDEVMLKSELRTHRLQCHPDDFYISTRLVRRKPNRTRRTTESTGEGHRGQQNEDESLLSPARIVCQICGDDEFENDTELFRHRKEHLQLQVNDADDDDDDELDLNLIKYKCLFCPGVFQGMELLEKHFGEVHKGNVEFNGDLEENESLKLNSIPKINKKKRKSSEMNPNPDPDTVVDKAMEDALSKETIPDFGCEDDDDDDEEKENGSDGKIENEGKIDLKSPNESTPTLQQRKKKIKRKRRKKEISTVTVDVEPTTPKPTPTPITLPKWSYRNDLDWLDDDEIEVADKDENDDRSSVGLKKKQRRRNRRPKNSMKMKRQGEDQRSGEIFSPIVEMFEKQNFVDVEVRNKRRSVNLVRHALQIDEEFRTPTPGRKNKKKQKRKSKCL